MEQQQEQESKPVFKVWFDDGFDLLYSEYLMNPTGQKLLDISGVSGDKLDVVTMMERYFDQHTGDMSIDANANVGNNKSPINLSAEVTKGISKLVATHLLWTLAKEAYGEARATEMIRAIWDGYLYFHDMTGHGVTTAYCFAASTINLVYEGRPYGQLHSVPPKRADSFMAQAIEYVMDLSQDFMGAIAVGDLLVNYAMLIKNEDVNIYSEAGRKRVENDIQKFIHIVNHKYRQGAQSAFVNISLFDRVQLEGLFKQYVYPDNSSPMDHMDHIMKIQRIYMNFMAKKDPSTGLPYRFPVSTVNITVEDGKILDPDFLDLVCQLNGEGVFNIYVTEGLGKVASCCRLLSDVSMFEDRQRADVWGNGGLNIGSTRVCTVNLVRLALESQTKNEFLEKLEYRLELARDLLVIHRSLLKDLIETDYLKFFKPLGWISLDRMFFSTIGVIGLYEAIELLDFENSLPDDRGIVFAEEILGLIGKRATEFTHDFNIPFNVEQIPAETAAITLAKKDTLVYPDNPYKLYSNQSIPLWRDVDLVTRARVDGRLNRCYSGGGICHLNVGSITTPEQMRKLIEFAVECGLDHFALNPRFDICQNKHVTLGSEESCPKCGASITGHVTRVVGYFVPIEDWTEVRREWEFPRRKWQTVEI